jgi:2'-5' RNA ligase
MNRTEHLRAFVALPLSGPHKEALARLIPDLKRAAPARLAVVRPGSWHLTLKFLGDVPLSGATGVPALIEALAAVDWEGFDLVPGGGGFFPGPRRPRVVYVGLASGDGGCRMLAAAVEKALAAVGIPREDRPFAPHLTVARVKDAPDRADRTDWGRVAGLLDKTDWPACRADRFVLYQSVLGPQGARHEELRSFPAR